jgi:hypothetical protein
MRNCVHNDVIGLSNRYLKSDDNKLTYDRDLVEDIVAKLANDIKALNGGILTPLSLEEFLATRRGGARKRYASAIHDIVNEGYDPLKHSKIKAFIKNEKYAEEKPPRMIMGRDPRFNLIYGRFTLALEKIVRKIKQFCLDKDFFQAGEFAQRNFTSWFLENDYSKFESTQREELLRQVELGLWSRILSPSDFALVQCLFEAKMFKEGKTSNGVKFQFYACRGSGDMDTTLFNTILNYVACVYFCKINNIPTEFLAKGDDTVIAVPYGFEPINTFSSFAFDAKLILRKSIYDTEFCSAKFLEYDYGKWMLCPDINKLLRNIGCAINPDFYHCLGHYYYSLGFMYKQIFGGSKLFDELANFLMSITKNKSVRFNLELIEKMNPVYAEILSKPVEQHHINNVVFEASLNSAFGLQRDSLERLYAYFRTQSVDISGRDKRFNKRGNRQELPTIDILSRIQREMEVSTLISYDALVDKRAELYITGGMGRDVGYCPE